ncbi:hypothetical protein HNI00_00590 [Thermoleptolyngbya oregonensis NK1-22]|uniref:Uncharacterized protein n=1 Tax=Thermoleptolyngbya oregonensis NK1-22 TaxID=2547457 RepID=A0AA96Y852_9CYAN|nr:hypothetical protein [Thermoleptolyngbya oregonensis]WOB41840.1 hypothetical protein HNI00_00590 [Thermoleptolyngbya oregonensis NK1-22]
MNTGHEHWVWTLAYAPGIHTGHPLGIHRASTLGIHRARALGIDTGQSCLTGYFKTPK